MTKFRFLVLLALSCIMLSFDANAAFRISTIDNSKEIHAIDNRGAIPIPGNSSASQIPELLYIILAIFPLCGTLAVGLNTDFKGYDWIIAGLLYFLFYFPGLIYTLLKITDFYGAK